jgi:uncharacterized protein
MPEGKICYVEIPATDIETSSRFYSQVFGWKIRTRGDGTRAFDDATGAVSGSWVLGRTPARAPGMVTYIMVDNIEATLKKVTANGGKLATPMTPLCPSGDAYATILDPGGNLLGIYQEPRS